MAIRRIALAVTLVGTVVMVPVQAGAAAVLCRGVPATIVGDAGDNILSGTPLRDVIHGLAGNDVSSGRGGNDLICGGKGDDDLSGEGGPDTIDGGGG